MATFDITKIEYAGGIYSSVVILDQNNDIIIPPSLFLSELAIRGRSINTISNYAYRLNSFFEVLEHSSPSISWNNISQHHIDIYLTEYLQKTMSLSGDSIEGHISAISGFYEYAWEFGFLSSPMAFCYKIKNDLKEQKIGNANELLEQYIPPEFFLKLLEFIDDKSDFLQERNELVFYLGYHMGLRAAEVVDQRNLRLSKLWNTPLKTISHKIIIVGKGEKIRTVTIPFLLQEKIKRFLLGRRREIPGDLLICTKDGNALNRSFASYKFRKTAQDSENTYFFYRTYHSLRHSYATNLVISCYEKGFDPWTLIPEQMGHEQYTTTLKYVFFEAVLNKRHSILKKLSVNAKNIGQKQTRKSHSE